MKSVALGIGFGFVVTLTAATIPRLAWSNSYSNTTTTAVSSSDGTSLSDQSGNNATQTEDNGASWQQSATDAAHQAENATEKAYNRVAQDVKDISLEARITAVLHENKSTRDYDVRATADKGTVTLTGVVSSPQDAQHVQDVVASVYGVKAVNNELGYPHSQRRAIPPDADSTGVSHPAYSDTAPAENAPADPPAIPSRQK
jgi:osmotically-inducible protein OsmY